jgi:hypothetical protein
MLTLKLQALKNSELPPSEDSEEKIIIIKPTVIVTHSRPMALFKEAVKVTEHFCFALLELHI